MRRWLLLAFLLLASPAAAQTTWSVSPPSGNTVINGLTMPTTDGSAGTCMSTNGAGVLGWASCSSGGTGLTSLNAQTGATQTFAKVDDTNVTLSITSATDIHTFTMGWTSTLSPFRGGTGQDSSAWTALPLVIAGTWSQYGGTAPCSPGSAMTALSAAGGATCTSFAGSGTVTTTGTPGSGNLTKFSGATSITNGDLTGDVTTSGTLATTLSSTGVSAGTYGQVTVDVKGRVTAASTVADVAHGGTGISFGSVGGIPWFSGTTTMAASSTLANHFVVVGGGAGAPHTIASTGFAGQFLQSQGASADPVWSSGGLTAVSLQPSTIAGLPLSLSAWGAVRLLTDSGTRAGVIQSGVLGIALDTPFNQWYSTNKPCNVQAWGAKSDGSNDDVAIRQAITDGCMALFLPKGTVWTPGSFVIPANVSIIGEDSSVTISQSGATCIQLAAGASLQNLTVLAVTCGGNNGKLWYYRNATGTTLNLAMDGNRGWLIDVGESGQDLAATGVNGLYGTGDNYYSQVTCGHNPCTAGDSSQRVGMRIDLTGNGTLPTGNIGMLIDHNTSSYAGDMIRLHGQDGSGTFTGRPIVYLKNGVVTFTLDSVGDVDFVGGLATGGAAQLGSGSINASNNIFTAQGFITGAATGGSQGPGTVNVSNAYYVNGTVGFTGIKTAGLCTFTIRGGIITNVTGC